MNSPPAFRLTLFGSPRLVGPDGAPLVGRAVQRHRIALLALLAVGPGQAASRDKLMGLLWPERDAEQARQLLNQAVYTLRKAIGEEALVSGADDLRLDEAGLAIDVREFETAIAEHELARAVDLYAGPLLDGFFLSDAPEFERWTSDERARLARAHAGALEALAVAAEENGDLPRAVEWWRRRVNADPYDTRVTMRLVRVLAAAGNPAGALQQASVHERLLRGELGVDPPAELAALVEELRRAPPPVPPVTLSEPVAATVERAAGAPAGAAAPASVAPGPSAGSPAVEASAAAVAPRGPEVLEAARPTPALHGRRRLGARGTAGLALAALAALAVPVLLLLARAQSSATPAAPAAPAAGASVAVLPLANVSGDPDDAPIADGITEELIAALSRSGELRVTASTSAMALRGRGLDVRSIAESLRVDHVVEGGVQRSGGRLRVRVRLIDARDGSSRWSESYDRELRDVFAVQDDIARSVARELGLRLYGGAPAPSRGRTRNVAAYELYLRGNDPTLLRSDSAAQRGLAYFEQAVALDSTFAGAWAGMARLLLRGSHGSPARGQRLEAAERAARRALALDDSSGEAYGALAAVAAVGYQLGAAEARLQRAVALEPSRVQSWEWLARLHVLMGRPADAVREAERAVNLDPLSPTAHAELARALLADGRPAECLAHLERIAGLRPPLLRAVLIAALCRGRQGRWPEAVALLRPRVADGGRVARAHLGYALARAGRRAEAAAVRDSLIARQRAGVGSALDVALVEAGLGEMDSAFAWLDRAVAERSMDLNVGAVLFDDLRRDPRFEAFRVRFGIHSR